MSAARMAASLRSTRSSAMRPFSPIRSVRREFYARAKVKSIGAGCPGWVKTGSPAWASECPKLGDKRKSISGAWRVTVGKRVAPFPPRRSRRALLTHRAPPSGRTSDGERFGRAHCLAHSRQSDRRRYPALCPDRGRLTAIPLGPGPFLHVLRRKLPSIVRTLLRYYGPVRLLTHVHVQRTACGLPEPARTESGRE
jgi:hypothetical protein